MAVSLGSAIGVIDLNITGAISKLRELGTATETAFTKMETAATKFSDVGKKFTKIGRDMTMYVTTPIVGAIGTIIKSYADLEQAVGGVNALFGESAGTVIANAERAYETAGFNSTTYMQQVTNFAARLLQGLGGDTEEAARIADLAITDIGDNVNRFGSDMDFVARAYQGFSRGQYLMLDNLRLGYGGTKGEMERLLADAEALEAKQGNLVDFNIANFDDIIQAIHVVQEELNITGTTAMEAETTITGSFTRAKAAFQNFLSGLGDPGADIDKLSQNLIDSIKPFIENIKEVLSTIWDNIPIPDWAKYFIVTAATTGPILLAIGKVSTALSSIITLGGQIPGVFSKLASGATSAVTAVKNIGEGFTLAQAGFSGLAGQAGIFSKLGAAIGGITAPIAAAVAAIAVLVAAFVTLWNNNEEFRNKITEIWNGIANTFSEFFQNIVDNINDLGFNFTSFTDMLSTAWTEFTELLAPVFVGAFEQISNAIKLVLNLASGLMDIFFGLITLDWDKFSGGFEQIFTSIIDFITNTFNSAINAISGILNEIVSWFGTTWNDLWEGAKNFFINSWNGITESLTTFVTNIITKGQEVVDGWTTNFIAFFTNLPENLGFLLGQVIGNIVLWIENMKTNATNAGEGFIDNLIKIIKNLPKNFKKWLDDTINNIKTWAMDIAENATNSAKTFITNIVNGIKNLPNDVNKFLTETISRLKTWVTDMGIKGREAITSLRDKIVEAARNLPQQVMEIGRNIVDGVWQGIQNAAGWFKGQVESFFGGMVDGVKLVLGIRSPSKVFADEVGAWIPPGIAMGFEQTMPKAAQDMQDELNKDLNKIHADDIEVGVESNNTIKNVTNTLKNTYEQLAIWFESIEQRIVNSINSMTNSLNNVVQQGNQLSVSGNMLGYIGPNSFNNSSAKDYDTGEIKEGNIPIINVHFDSLDVLLDNERVGRVVAPVVSRIMVE